MSTIGIIATGVGSFLFSFFAGIMALEFVGRLILTVHDMAIGAGNNAKRANQPPPPPPPPGGLFKVASRWTIDYAGLGMIAVPVIIGLFFYALFLYRLWIERRARIRASTPRTRDATSTSENPSKVADTVHGAWLRQRSAEFPDSS